MAKGVEKSAAVVTIREANEMTAKGRRAVAKWLRMHADMLEREGNNYSRRFTGRYLYRTKAA
jgi:hypothetical protein